MSPSDLIRNVETDLHQARARGLLKHPRQTYTEYKAERKRKLAVYQAYGWGVLALAAVAVSVKSCVG